MELHMLDSRRTDLQIVDLLYLTDFDDLIVGTIVHIQLDMGSSTSLHSFISFYGRLWFLLYTRGIFSEEQGVGQKLTTIAQLPGVESLSCIGCCIAQHLRPHHADYYHLICELLLHVEHCVSNAACLHQHTFALENICISFFFY